MSNTNPETQDDVTSESTTRRGFLELAGGASAGTLISKHVGEVEAAIRQVTGGDVEVVWLQGQSCTGCTISMLQGQHPALEDVLSEFRLAVTFHPTLMTETGESALDAMSKEPDVLIMEGAVPAGMPQAATVGHTDDGHSKPILDWVERLAPRAEYVVAVGNCAAFGGWLAAGHGRKRYDRGDNVTGAHGLQFQGRNRDGVLDPAFTSGAGLPVVNLQGCPPKPDTILLTLTMLLNGNPPELDEYNRPVTFYESPSQDGCSRRRHSDRGGSSGRHGRSGRGHFHRPRSAEKAHDEGPVQEDGRANSATYRDGREQPPNGGTNACLNGDGETR
ncbi:NADH-quinone oxidoreductase subunit B family protein [Halorhabdus rudnickae]|uniref:NADH-quinone oxidoreductase subunit B family protein n=1 Tax=Halorhabdus rudnickae TaxID=1775544 RepID=UPI00108395B5|nr:[NiFe] hydrogenase small subunit HydA [Halorhabdus rudnickae]